MKALVLSGGMGTRLRPFTHNMPKQLVPVAGKPVLFHGLETLRAAGVTDVGLIVAAPGTEIRAAVGDGSRFGVNVTYLPQDEPRGLAHCVVIARDFLGDDDFVMYLGDNVFAGGIEEPLAEFRERKANAQLVVVKVPDPTEYGVVEFDRSGRVTGLQEKPARPRSNFAVTGAYFFTSQVHEAVRNIRPSWRNEWEITDAIRWMVDQGLNVRAHAFSGFWKDTGSVADLLECNKALLEDIKPGIYGAVDQVTELHGPVLIESGAQVEYSRIVGPAIIGAGSTVHNSCVGPYASIGSGCELLHAAVEESIVLDRACVQRVRPIQRSIIGRAAQVRQGRREPFAHRLVVGDDSHVEVP